jgi:hypothetical protein
MGKGLDSSTRRWQDPAGEIQPKAQDSVPPEIRELAKAMAAAAAAAQQSALPFQLSVPFGNGHQITIGDFRIRNDGRLEARIAVQIGGAGLAENASLFLRIDGVDSDEVFSLPAWLTGTFENTVPVALPLAPERPPTFGRLGMIAIPSRMTA